ncbi:MAG: biotin synthase BioB [Deltaproteobacteria bacterium]|nr:biotin synthase BioB [Deltaproteobacteria bacterium]MBW1953194.1 biotin synthase BioB [Deltaproteobacteria bacterium]MBW1985982.1 biotin synthase BioB [Deltaproteobacteria bacterium]
MHLSDWEELFRRPWRDLWPLLATASQLRERRVGQGISLCVIINAKSGLCSQDCAFCAQSRVSQAEIKSYPLLASEQLVAAAQQAASQGAARFAIVTSGRGIVKEQEQEIILNAIGAIRSSTSLKVCVSLGIVGPNFLKALAQAGVHRYHHNLETAASFFPQICTAHTYEERLQTIRAAQAAGLAVCVGGIFGLGESVAQRWEMAQTMKELEVDSIPLNFLHPIPGTPLGSRPLLKPLEALKIILAFRLSFPDKRLIICGGRIPTLRSLAPLMFAAGADALMTGDYLTTKGRLPDEDLQMLADQGLYPATRDEQ